MLYTAVQSNGLNGGIMANKQTGSLDLKAAKGAHDDASTKATNFLAIDSTGIMVADLSTNTGITPSTADGRNVFIDSDSVDIRNGQTVLASFGETVTIGDTQKAYIEVTSDTIAGHADTDYFSISSSGGKKQQWAVMSNTAKKAGVGRSSITINIATDENYVDVWATLPNGTRFKVVIYTIYSNITFVDEEECVKGTESPNYGNFGNAECGYNGINSIAFYPTLYPQNHAWNGTWKARQFLLYVYKETNSAFYRFGQDVATEGGHYSFLMGEGTKASYENQLAIGKYNADVSDGVFIIGNGENNNARSNAFAVDNSGNVTAAGEIRGATSKTVITTFSSGWDVYSTDPSAPITLRRCGKFVDLTGAIRNTTAVTLNATQVTIFTIPEGYRPSQTMTILSQGSSMNVFVIRIKASGGVTFERYRSTNSTSTSYSSISEGAWFPIHAAWIMD